MTKTRERSIKRFADLNIHNGDAEKYVKKAMPILKSALIDALAKYNILTCKVKMTMRYNGTINVEVREDSVKARKEKYNFLMMFNIVGDKITEFSYSGPVPTTPQFTRNVICKRASPMKVSKVVGGLWARKDDMVLKARELQDEAQRIAAFDERVIYALEAFRVTLDDILKKVTIK